MNQNDAISRSALVNGLKRIKFPELKSTHEFSKELYQSIKKLYYSIINVIETEPALDVAPVVRCKDCQYRGDSFRCPLVIRVRDTVNFRELDNALDDDFCSRGRRKDEKEG